MESSTGALPAQAGRLDASAISSSTGRLSAKHGTHSRSSSMRRRAETSDSDKAGRVWAREVDDPWWPCILTLDGGGIRGYSSLWILKALMHEVWLWEQKLEEEDRRKEEEQDGLVVDSPLLAPQADGGAEEPHGRSPLQNETKPAPSEDQKPRSGDNAKSTEEAYGVAKQEPPAENQDAPPAQRTVQHDHLTAGVSAKKAMSEEELLPCHYFDFMYGTSTGGLIATMLGRLRMTVTECLELYRSVGDDLFGKRRSRLPLMTKYYHEPLEKAVQDIVGSRCHEHENCDGKDDLHPWGVYMDDDEEDDDDDDKDPDTVPLFDVDEPRVCQTCCLTATHDEQISEAYLLRSYPHYYTDDAPNWITRYNEGADALPIWKVTRATTAAPFYFEMVRADVAGISKAFKDGGIRENNPSGAALSEFHALYEGKAPSPALLLSIGTGRPDQSQDGFAGVVGGSSSSSTGTGTTLAGSLLARLPFITKFLEKRAVVQNLLIKYTEGEKQHHQMREHARGEHTWYKRLNVSRGLENMPLDDWVGGSWHGKEDVPGGATLERMEQVTEEYLHRGFEPSVDSYAPPATMLTQAAEKLVRMRRARERMGGRRWEVFVGAEGYGHGGRGG
ncbi:hypothetical protein KC347_g6682 [Hortaea werneckii]|nr:hypothetical protein KC347_g6682 [Hortaea werneckii]